MSYNFICFMAIAAVFFPAQFSCAFQSQSLPDPFAPQTHPTSVTVASSPQAPQDFPLPSVPRGIASSTVAAIATVADQVKQDGATVANLEKQMRALDDRLNALIAARDAALAELRQGLYCSRCNRTKSEIEATGENFWEHLRRVNGVPIPAPQSVIDAKAKEYDQQINAMAAENDRQKQQIRAQIAEKKKEVQAAIDQIRYGIRLWQTATTFEQDLIAGNEVLDKRRLEAAAEFAGKKLKGAEAGRSKMVQQGANQGVLDEADLAIKLWQETKQRAENDASNRWDSYVSDLRTADEMRTKEFVRIKSILNAMDDSAAQSGIGGLVPTFSFSVGRVSLDSSPAMLGAKFAFGPGLVGGVEAGDVDAATTEARAFIQLIGKVRLSAVWRTEISPDGIHSYPTIDLNLPAVLKPKPKDNSNQGTDSSLPIP